MQLQPFQFIWKNRPTQGNSPHPRYGHSAIVYQNSIIIFGGENNETGETFNDIHLLDLETWTWMQPQVWGDIPTSRSFHTAVLAEDKMLIWGGYQEAKDGGYIFSDIDVHILNLQTWQWSHVTPNGTPPTARSHHSAALVKDKLFIDGGSYDIYTAYNDLHLLDLTKMCWINIQVDNCSSSALAGLKVHGNTLVKFLGDAAYGGFCQDILTLELGNLNSENLLQLQWQKAKFVGIDDYKYKILLPNSDEEEENEEYDEEEGIPCRTIHGYGEFGYNLILFAGMAPGNGVSHVTIGDLILLNMPAVEEATSGTYTAMVPLVGGKFPAPRFGHSTIQFARQTIVYGGLWIDTYAGNHSYDNDVYILEIL
ncbi:MAG: kelch repeat-containing protein [Aulosira sp. ZfuVER01]|nr:kelch repeat-containing protein [Aulosira sp. ZfuVER01]MDZ8002573.1 kelch repeat-containing protein [Aulosira sp. DedVER01a]MDZ8050749.1 kelch repeat-containing protein [Aulosira sp. ZfuCHP01]